MVSKENGDVISFSHSQEISPAMFCNKTAVTGCSIFLLETILSKTLIVQTKTGASMGILQVMFY